MAGGDDAGRPGPDAGVGGDARPSPRDGAPGRLGDASDGGVDEGPDARAPDATPRSDDAGGGDIDAPAPEIVVSPALLDFGRVRPGEERTLTLTVRNIGEARLTLQALTVEGAPDFVPTIAGRDPREAPEILEDPDGSGGPGLDPAGQFEIEVSYRPAEDEAARATLTISSNDPVRSDYEVDLMGNMVTPCIRVVPEALEFPPTPVGGTATLPVTIESCGAEPLHVTRIELSADTSGAFRLGELPPLPAGLPPHAPGEPQRPGRRFDVRFTPPDGQVQGGTLVIESNDPQRPVVEVLLVGRGAPGECPVPAVEQAEFDVRPLDVVRLDGGRSSDPDGAIAAYRWVVMGRPEGSTAEPVEAFGDRNQPQNGGPPDDVSTPQALFFVDLAGSYTVELRVTDETGLEAPSEASPGPMARVTIRARPPEDIHVQLVWDTPGDADQRDLEGADVDLHFMHPSGTGWGEMPGDCFYGNPEPDWGLRNHSSDDPSLDIDDVNGAGPENINLDHPEDISGFEGGYQIGVHYFRAETFLNGNMSLGPSNATVRVYLEGELAYEATGTLEATDHFWHAAEIRWTPDVREVVEIDRHFEQLP